MYRVCFNLFALSDSHLTSHRCRVRCWVIEKYAPALRCQRYLFANMFFPEIELANNTDKICYLLFSSVLILAKEFLNILNDGVGHL